ncbi:MAG: NPCBM/NEW2 domain-containing protein [Planctomycetaceae bacterium]
MSLPNGGRPTGIAVSIVLLSWLVNPSVDEAADAHRFTAMRTDGSMIEGGNQEIVGWGDPAAKPSLQGQQIFDSANPFRWLIDHSLPLPLTPAACVEFVGGDRLPGKVVDFSDGRRSPFGHWPPHLLVVPTPDAHVPANPNTTMLRVKTRWLRRVIWKRQTGQTYQPASVFLRDGSRVAFVSLRWSSGAVRLLTDDGLRTLFFSEIAEVHLPRQDEWRAYFEQLALLAPTCVERLMQVETTEGLVATTSPLRFQATFRGDRKRPEHWYHMIQPAWGIDPLWIPHRSVRHRRFFQPHQVPLTLFTPSQAARSSTFATAWSWQVNRNVQHSPLRSSTVDWGWGFGVHGGQELSFVLSPLARQLRIRMGLDRIVDTGGCVKASVRLDGKPLFNSDVLVGSQQIINPGLLHLGTEPNPRNLTLSVDPISESAPPGADPFDIRDMFDWGEPEIELDSNELQRLVAQQHSAAIPAFQNWQLATPDLKIANLWDVTDPADPRFRIAFQPASPYLSCRRDIRVGDRDAWLSVAVAGATDKPTHTRLQVRIDGRSLGEFAIPAGIRNEEPVPLLLPISDFRGRRVHVELCWMPGENATNLLLRAVSLLERRPGLLKIFEDAPQFAEQLNEGEGEVHLDTDEKHHGTSAIKVDAPGRGASQLPGLNAAIRACP